MSPHNLVLSSSRIRCEPCGADTSNENIRIWPAPELTPEVLASFVRQHEPRFYRLTVLDGTFPQLTWAAIDAKNDHHVRFMPVVMEDGRPTESFDGRVFTLGVKSILKCEPAVIWWEDRSLRCL
jgi:hypothetical protein